MPHVHVRRLSSSRSTWIVTFVVSRDRHPDSFDDSRVSRPLGVTFVVSRDPVPHTALDTPAIVRAYRYCTVLGSSHLRLLVVQVLCVFGDVLPFAFGLRAYIYYELCFVHVQVMCMCRCLCKCMCMCMCMCLCLLHPLGFLCDYFLYMFRSLNHSIF